MKASILHLLFSLIAINSFCQQLKSYKFSKEQYAHKKKISGLIGYGLLGTSAFLFVKGGILAKKQREETPNATMNLDGFGQKIWGGISGLASIPFFLIASHYKNKAVSLSIHNENNLMHQENNLVFTRQPTVSLKVIF